MLAERFLDSSEYRRFPGHGFDFAPVCLHCKHQTGACAPSIENDGAGTANAMFAPDMGSGQAKDPGAGSGSAAFVLRSCASYTLR